jgi:hypothetical protein
MAEEPLTVHKLRKGRRSVLDGSFEEDPSDRSYNTALSEVIKRTAGKSLRTRSCLKKV